MNLKQRNDFGENITSFEEFSNKHHQGSKGVQLLEGFTLKFELVRILIGTNRTELHNKVFSQIEELNAHYKEEYP
jgi:hypothetical protein